MTPGLKHDLRLLEHDAIAACDPTIEGLENPFHEQRIGAFREDHLRQVADLERMGSQLKVDAPKGGDMEQLLTTGDDAISKAMEADEGDTVSACERASRHAEAKPETRCVVESAAAGRRHREGMDGTSQAS